MIKITMNEKPILFFDSGIGGLTVLREARILMPDQQFIYFADDAAFPYGAWQEKELKAHIIALFYKILDLYKPQLCVISCNTASTLVLEDLRLLFPDISFVGTVPAIKPAAEKTRSKLISVLATTGTVERAYTHDLIESFASQCDVKLVGSNILASVAEDYLRGEPVDMQLIEQEIAPCFVEKNGQRTDIVVLACTHYPFLVNLFRKVAPWPVDWLDPAEAIAKRALSLLPIKQRKTKTQSQLDTQMDYAYFSCAKKDYATIRLLHGFGLKYVDMA